MNRTGLVFLRAAGMPIHTRVRGWPAPHPDSVDAIRRQELCRLDAKSNRIHRETSTAPATLECECGSLRQATSQMRRVALALDCFVTEPERIAEPSSP